MKIEILYPYIMKDGITLYTVSELFARRRVYGEAFVRNFVICTLDLSKI